MSRETLPDVLAVMTHPFVRTARRSGAWVLAANADLSQIVWASEAAAGVFGLAPGPQMVGSGELCTQISAALQHDGASASGSVPSGAGVLSQERIAIGPENRRCILVAGAPGGGAARDGEGLAALSEVGDQPIAIWSSERSWFDAGFGAMDQVHLEDLYDLKDSGSDFDLAFLSNGGSAGLAKISRRLIAVWHLGDERLLRFDLDPEIPSDQEADAADIGSPAAVEHARSDEGSFVREIETIKSVSGSLLSAAGAALGGAVLERLAGSGGEGHKHRPDGIPHPLDNEMPEESPPSSEGDNGEGTSPAVTGSAVSEESASAIRDPSARSGDPESGEADAEEGLPRDGVISTDTHSDTYSAPASSVLTVIAGGIGAAAAYHFAQKEREDAAGEAEMREQDPAHETDHAAISDGTDAEDLDGTTSDDGAERHTAQRRVPLRSNWSMAGAVAPAALAENAGSQSSVSASGNEEVSLAGDNAPSDLSAPDASEDRAAAGGAAQPSAEPDDTEAVEAEFDPDFTTDPTRFVWRLDQDGRFHALSQEFAAVVGPRAADVIGISFADLSEALDLDPREEIAPLIDRRETWSDRTVFWPVEASDKRVPIDLAALPVYSRDRSFDGFRGFGVARPADAEDDPAAWGLKLATGTTMHDIVAQAMRNRPVEEIDFGVDDRDDHDDPSSEEMRPEPGRSLEGVDDQVVQLAERRARNEALLSDEEAAAFRTIGVALSSGERNPDLEEAIRIAKQKIAHFGGALPSVGDVKPDPQEHAASDDHDMDAEAGRPGTTVVADLQAYYSRLPVPILVQSGDDTVFTNEEFADLTGYRDAASLAAAGGLDHLFEESTRGEFVRLRRANDKTIEVRARMQRIAMGGKSFLVISFFASPRLTVTDLGTVPEATAGEMAPIQTPDADDPESRLAALMEGIETKGEAVLLLDQEGRVEAANDRANGLFAGTDAADRAGDERRGGEDRAALLIGMTFSELFDGESRARAGDLICETTPDLQDERVGGDGDLTICMKDGEKRVLAAVAVPMEHGGWCVAMREIGDVAVGEEEPRPTDSDAEAARLRAEEESLRKTQFLAAVSHEIRTPMTAVLGFADAIESEAFGPIGNPRYLDYIADIKRSSRHVLDLVNDLLELSKAEAGRLQLSFRTVALNQVAGEVVSMMQPVAGGARVVLRSNLPPSVPPVIADERSLRQIVTNLIQNAINSTPGGGQIIVSSQYREDGSVTLRCRDNGVGMTDAELEIAKQPYGRVKSDAGPDRLGTGLGLPLAFAMAGANGAEISVESAPQHGTMVELRFAPDRVVTG
ncbi:PAS domain-containing sensor histidine kinase [Fulvimarina sp. MAC3]|uniref:sensor histidine kinase n=1 Tax=Fulvimarina sp. MAC3 TaxID=3148887 RepID=UPI0031FCF66D